MSDSGSDKPIGDPISAIESSYFGDRPLVEVEVVHEVTRTAGGHAPWRMLELYTENSLYRIDIQMRCVEVVDLATNELVPRHALLGARLLGGQHLEDDVVYLSHPFPRPGTEAVFEQPAAGGQVAFSHTSNVTRVVLRIRLISVVTSAERQSWDEIARARLSHQHGSAADERATGFEPPEG